MEGIGSSIEKNESRIFYYTNSKRYETVLKKAKIEQLKEGIIMGAGFRASCKIRGYSGFLHICRDPHQFT